MGWKVFAFPRTPLRVFLNGKPSLRISRWWTGLGHYLLSIVHLTSNPNIVVVASNLWHASDAASTLIFQYIFPLFRPKGSSY